MEDPSQRAISRRSFLGIVGAAGAAGVAGCSPRPTVQKLVPYLVPPEDVIPGTPLFYRTACHECPAGCGVTARTREGRVVKLEGNPDDPVGRGALCARGQAALQALYHPDRFQGPLARSGGALAPISWDDAEARVVRAMTEARGRGPGRVRLLTCLEPGIDAVAQRAFLAAAGGRPADRVVLELLDPAPLRATMSPSHAPWSPLAPSFSRAGARRWSWHASSQRRGLPEARAALGSRGSVRGCRSPASPPTAGSGREVGVSWRWRWVRCARSSIRSAA